MCKQTLIFALMTIPKAGPQHWGAVAGYHNIYHNIYIYICIYIYTYVYIYTYSHYIPMIVYRIPRDLFLSLIHSTYDQYIIPIAIV